MRHERRWPMERRRYEVGSLLPCLAASSRCLGPLRSSFPTGAHYALQRHRVRRSERAEGMRWGTSRETDPPNQDLTFLSPVGCGRDRNEWRERSVPSSHSSLLCDPSWVKGSEEGRNDRISIFIIFPFRNPVTRSFPRSYEWISKGSL